MERSPNDLLLQSAYDGSLSGVQDALRCGAQLVVVDKHGSQPIHLAVMGSGSVREVITIMKILVEYVKRMGAS